MLKAHLDSVREQCKLNFVKCNFERVGRVDDNVIHENRQFYFYGDIKVLFHFTAQ